jgi:uncharacterized membrane protein (UPF0136 family)
MSAKVHYQQLSGMGAQDAYTGVMIEPADDSSSAIRQLLVVAALMAVGYVCIRTLCFTNDGLNLAFVCGFLLLPFFAIRPVLRLRGWPHVLMTVLVAPLLALSMLALLFTASCNIPAYVQHRELNRELSRVQQGRYSVHLLWQETAGGAVGPHGIGLEQRMFIFHGLYMVKHLDYFEGAHEGSLSAEGADKVRLHIRQSSSHQEVDKVYSLKQRVYF